MRNMNPTRGTIRLATSGALATREGHVCLVVMKPSLRIIALWEMNIGTQRRRIAIAVHMREPSARSGIIWILNTNAVEPIGILWVGRYIVGRAGTCELDRLYSSLVCVEDIAGTAWRWCTQRAITDKHAQTNGEGFDLVVGCFEEVIDVHVEHWD